MMPSAFSPDEIDQLKRAAQMFEMILDTGAQTHEAYETLKDVYVKLGMDDDYRRVTARFADYLLARDDHDEGVAQLTELASRYPEEAQWRDRLVELGAPVPAEVCGADNEAPTEALEEDIPSDGAVVSGGPDEEGPEREAVHAFNQLKAIAEFQALEALRQSGDDDLERAIGEAEKILCELDEASLGAQAELVPSDQPDGSEAGESQPEAAAAPPDEPELAEEAAVETADAEPAEPEPEEAEAAEVEAAAAEAAEPEPGEVEAAEAEAAEVESAEPEAAEVEAAQTESAEPEAAQAEGVEAAADEVDQDVNSAVRLGEMMVEQGVITRDNLETALAKQRESGELLGNVLVGLGYATEADVLHCLTLQAGVPYLPLGLYEVQRELAALLPESFARQHHVVPVDVIANSVLVAIAARLRPEAKQELEALLGERKVNYYISALSEIDKRLDELYPGAEPEAP